MIRLSTTITIIIIIIIMMIRIITKYHYNFIFFIIQAFGFCTFGLRGAVVGGKEAKMAFSVWLGMNKKKWKEEYKEEIGVGVREWDDDNDTE